MRSNEKTVGQITHNSLRAHENACDEFSLRVKSEPFIGSVIDVDGVEKNREFIEFIRRRSHTELTSDSHSRPATAEDKAPKQHGTPVSRGTVPSQKSPAASAACGAAPTVKAPKRIVARPSAPAIPLHNAGPLPYAPAFSLRVGSVSLPAARRPGFISVSGQCAARSAHSSDMRIKRISGGVAATEHLRAPMNSPTGGFAVQRVSLTVDSKGDSPWL